MHIAIAGNIGAGKTTLTKMLSKRYGWKAHFEPVDNNPYLHSNLQDKDYNPLTQNEATNYTFWLTSL